MNVGVVRVVGILSLRLGGDAPVAPQAVLHCRVHLEQSMGLPISLLQTVLDDPCRLPVVLLPVDLSLNDGGLGQDLLVVLLGHLELLEAGDGLGDHLLDQVLRRGVLGDVIGARGQPALDVAPASAGRPMPAVSA